MPNIQAEVTEEMLTDIDGGCKDMGDITRSAFIKIACQKLLNSLKENKD